MMGKYLSKRSLIKHIYSWHNKLIMNIEQISENIFTFIQHDVVWYND